MESDAIRQDKANGGKVQILQYVRPKETAEAEGLLWHHTVSASVKNIPTLIPEHGREMICPFTASLKLTYL